jgi:UDP-glucose 4-epimerase
MKVLITGVAGFIGSHTAEKFIKEGHTVFGVDDLSTGSKHNIPPEVDFKFLDITDEKEITKAFSEKPDAVIHLAAQPSLLESQKYPRFDATVNILGTINVLEASLKVGVKRFVFASTSAVYSTPDTAEDSTQLFPTNPYGISKFSAERYVKALSPYAVILRYANVYGPRQVPLGENQLVPRVLDHVYNGADFVINGDGLQTRDFIYVKDVAEANYVATVGALPEDVVFNVSVGVSHTVLDVVQELARLTAFTGDIKKGPAKQEERVHVQMPNALMMQNFDWEPQFTLHEGLKETVLSHGK